MNRCKWLTASLGLALLVGLQAQAADKVSVGRAANAYSFVPIEVGNAVGIFPKLGLDVGVTTFAGAAKLNQAMVAGVTDVALTGATDISFSAKGAPTTTVGAIVTKPVNMAISVGNNIKSVADLKGKKIAVTQAGTITYWMALELARVEGWGPHGVTPVSAGGIPAQVAALLTGHVDAVASDTAAGLMLETKHRGRVLITLQQYVPNFFTLSIIAQNNFMKEHPAVLKRFMKGWYETVAYMIKHKDISVKEGMKVSGLDEQMMSREYEAQQGMWSLDGKVTKAQLERVSQALVDIGLLPTKVDLEKYYNPSFLPN